MRRIRHILVIMVATMIAACTSRSVSVEGDVLVLDVEHVAEGRDVDVSELAESAEVIALEDADDAFFEFRCAWHSAHLVVVQARNGLIRLFGSDGRYVGMLDGVDESAMVYDLAIDEERKSIFVSCMLSDSLLVFSLDGRKQASVPLMAECRKPLVRMGSDGVVVAQFDFSDHPSGFNVAMWANGRMRYAARPSMDVRLVDEQGTVNGYNHDIIGQSIDGQVTFMTTFCDTLFRYDAATSSIVPVLTARRGRHDASNADSTDISWLHVNDLPRHYLVTVSGANAQSIIIDKESLAATRGRIVFGDDIGGCSSSCDERTVQRLYFDNDYAYTVLPPDGKRNSVIVRWLLSRKPCQRAAMPPLPKPLEDKVEWDTSIGDEALHESRSGNVSEAMRMIDAVIAQARVKRGHPSLAYACMVKSVLLTQMEQHDSAYAYRLLVNAPLTHKQQRDIAERLMQVHGALGNYEEAQRYAVEYGAMSDLAQGTQYLLEVAENRERISNLNEQADKDSRLRLYLWLALAAVVVAACAVIAALRRQRRKLLIATRTELQSLMEQRIEAMTADREQSAQKAAELRDEIMRNHAIIRRISKASRPLSDAEENMLSRITQMLYPELSYRLQQRATAPLTKRELTICFLFRFGVPQASIATLLDWKANTLRVAKSRLKRDRFQLPVDVELEDFIAKI